MGFTSDQFGVVWVIIKAGNKGRSRDQKSEVNLDNQIITLNLHLSG